jgi:hypothetical protein
MTKLIAAIRHFANSPKNLKVLRDTLGQYLENELLANICLYEVRTWFSCGEFTLDVCPSVVDTLYMCVLRMYMFCACACVRVRYTCITRSYIVCLK